MTKQRLYTGGKEIKNIESIFPRAVFYGDGVFETMRWKGAPPVFISRHIDRLLRAAAFLEIPSPPPEAVKAEITGAVEKSGFADCAVKICLISGAPPSPFFEKPSFSQILVSVTEITDDLSGVPLKIIFSKKGYSRNSSPLSAIKTLNYLENVAAMREAGDAGFDDALLRGEDGCVAETTCRNIFWGKNGEIFTPPEHCGILPGITRGFLMEKARESGFQVSELMIQPEDMSHADFVFATNSLSGIRPVDKIQLQDLTLTFSTSVNKRYAEIKNIVLQALNWV